VRRLAPIIALVVGVLGFGVGATLFVSAAVRSDQILFLPAPAQPVAPVVHVAGEPADPTPDGAGFYYVAITERPASVLETWCCRPDGSQLVPERALVPAGSSQQEQHVADQTDMTDSQRVAAAVAEKALGKPVKIDQTGARVIDTAFPNGTSPARRAGLVSGDIITAVNGHRVTGFEDLHKALATVHPGAVITVAFTRDGLPHTTKVTTVASPYGPGTNGAVMGVSAEDALKISLPVPVTYSIGDVEGPSAGLAFALEVYSAMTGGKLADGHRVAVTGAINVDGSVGEIGGAAQKAIGAGEAKADVFLVPAGNLKEAAAHAPSGVKVIPVRSFADALKALRSLPPPRA
jgi:PDZ domain-containing protein